MTGNLFDSYRTEDDRKAMIAFVMHRHAVNHDRAVSMIRSLGAAGLAYLWRDARASAGEGRALVDYDPCERGR